MLMITIFYFCNAWNLLQDEWKSSYKCKYNKKHRVISKYREKAFDKIQHIHDKNTQGLQSDKEIYEKPHS